jgi:hypothetical protein
VSIAHVGHNSAAKTSYTSTHFPLRYFLVSFVYHCYYLWVFWTNFSTTRAADNLSSIKLGFGAIFLLKKLVTAGLIK